MNVLFLSLIKMNTLDEHGIYQDLLREFIKNGDKVYVVSPSERRYNEKTAVKSFDNYKILSVRTGNIQKTNIIEKGISTLLIEYQLMYAIKKYYGDVKFDLILYATPPITFAKTIQYVKKRDNARTYLMLKDIFPQNAVDLGMLSKKGLKGIIYKVFRKKEKKLYQISDTIGCMSQANVDYVLKYNLEISSDKVEICPNSIEFRDLSLSEQEKETMRNRYGIPLDKKVFVYGGNLGKPQGVDHIIECLKTQEENEKAFFLIVGDGTEFYKLEKYFKEVNPKNMKLMKRLPKDDYDQMIASCDIGMIFLDYRFTIPNFPSRLLSYMQAGLPILACTDKSTDIGKVIVESDFGWWCESNDTATFCTIINDVCSKDKITYNEKQYQRLLNRYDVKSVYNLLFKEIFNTNY